MANTYRFNNPAHLHNILTLVSISYIPAPYLHTQYGVSTYTEHTQYPEARYLSTPQFYNWIQFLCMRCSAILFGQLPPFPHKHFGEMTPCLLSIRISCACLLCIQDGYTSKSNFGEYDDKRVFQQIYAELLSIRISCSVASLSSISQHCVLAWDYIQTTSSVIKNPDPYYSEGRVCNQTILVSTEYIPYLLVQISNIWWVFNYIHVKIYKIVGFGSS